MKMKIARLTNAEPVFLKSGVGVICDAHARIHAAESSEVLRSIAKDRRALAYYNGLIWHLTVQGDTVYLIAGKQRARIAYGQGDQAWINATLTCPHFFKRAYDTYDLARAIVFRDPQVLAKHVDILKARAERPLSTSLSMRACADEKGICLEMYGGCEACGRYMPYAAMLEIGFRRYCPACAATYRTEECCCGCGSKVLCSLDSQTADGYACAECINTMDRCIICNDLTAHIGSNGEHICEACEEQSVRCDACGSYVHEDDAHFSDAVYCQACYDHLMQERDNLINIYSYKPTPVYHGHGLQLGMELETSFTDPDDRASAALAISEEVPSDIAYMKEDGSLSHGIEIVSHPHDLASWHDSALKYYGDAIDRFSDFAVDGRDGIHIHVDRRGMSSLHQIKFSLFFAVLQDKLCKIADRRSSWAVYDDRPECGREYFQLIDRGGRYRATNFNNRSTVEVRIFRSTLNISKISAYLELVDAIYHFTRSALRTELENADVWKNFCKFLKYQEKYNNISNLIKELGL